MFMLYSVRRLVFALGLVSFLLTGEGSQAQSAEKEAGKQKKQGQEKSPPKVEEGKKTVNGVELYYKAIGSGDTIIVLHGGPGLDHTELLPQYQQLAKEFRLLFYDQRACGKSSGLFDEKSINVDKYVEDLGEIRKAFGIEKANILGYSWGGLLAMFYTIKHPEAVGKLILVDSAPASLTELEDFGKVLDQRRSDAEKKELAQIRSSAEYLAGDPQAVTASNRLGFRAYCFDPDRAKEITLEFTPKSAKAFIEVGNLFDKTLFGPGYDIHSKLKAITCPTLVVHGDTDPIQPKFLKTVSDEIKGSRFILLDKCGHFSHVEQPTKLFDQITRFMRPAVRPRSPDARIHEKRPEEKGSEKKQLEKLEIEWGAAIETNDPKQIARFFADDFIFIGAKGLLQTRMQHLYMNISVEISRAAMQSDGMSLKRHPQ
jgi:proline iminopeptidase